MRTSVAGAARKARAEDKKIRKAVEGAKQTFDSYQNFIAKMGLGTDNLFSGSTYGFNPITRIRTLLEWIHRGSWIGGVAVDLVADDMTRRGVDIHGELKPEQLEKIHTAATQLQIWPKLNETVQWSRLYGGSLAVMLVDGQDVQTPLQVDRIGPGQFKGLLVLDRWMIDPSLNNLVTEFGPYLGLPKYYKVTMGQALVNKQIHYSRCLRLSGVSLPYQQRLQENLWGLSILERIYDRMVAFDSATTGAAQLVFKSYLRTYKIKDLRSNIASGGPVEAVLIKYLDMMRRFQGIEGVTLIDGEDEFVAHTHAAFAGISDALMQFGQQLSGALQIPLVRLFGQSPAGLNSTGESDIITYYDNIQQEQENELKVPVTTIYRLIAQSEGIQPDDGFGITFKPLWQLRDKEKTDIATTTTEAVTKAFESGIISQKTAMMELKQSSDRTGIFTNITDEDVEAAEAEAAPMLEEEPEGEETETQDAVRIPADKAGYVELPGAVKDGDCNVVQVSGGISKQKGCCNNFALGKGAPKEFKCGSCKFHTDEVGLHDGPATELVWTCPQCGTGMYKKDIKKGWGKTACKECGAPRPKTSKDNKFITPAARMLGEVHGLSVVIESPKGTMRRGPWGEAALASDYGFLRDTAGADGDEIDCFIGPEPESPNVFIIDQKHLRGTFDEHKVMFGYYTVASALDDFKLSHNNDVNRVMSVSELTMPQFKLWLQNGDFTRPYGVRGT